MFNKKQKCCAKHIHWKTDDPLCDWEAIYEVKIVFIHGLMMASLSVNNVLQNRVAIIYIKLTSITSKLHNMSASITFIKKAIFVDVITKFI